MICSIVLRISRTLICSKRLYGLLRHGKNQLEEGCIVRRQFVKVIDFLEGERSRFPGKRTAENDGEGRMGNEHLSRRSSPTASTSFHPAVFCRAARFSVSPEGLGWRGQDVGDDGISAF